MESCLDDGSDASENMHAFWLALGTVVLVVGLLDVFLTVLNYDESGFLATRLCVLQWRCFRRVTRRLSRRWRPFALRQVTGLQIMLSVMTWLGCVIIGFGFIYYGLMYGTNFQYDGRGFGAGMFASIYLSAAQLATVGTSQITPETEVLRVLTIAETLSGLVLVTLMLTFLIGVYQVIRDLRTLASNFNTEGGGGDPVASLGLYFPQGQPVGLDSHLQAISDSFWSYTDGLRLHHIAYYFQSGRDQFSLPYSLYMMGRTLAALRWGLPSDHPVSVQPVLAQLITQFEHFADYLHDELDWTSTAVPEIISFDDFSAAHRSSGGASDVRIGRFFGMNRDMGQFARIDPSGNLREAYERYRRWLPFAYLAEQVTAAVSRDLDYQPIVRAGERVRPEDTTRTSGGAVTGRPLVARTLARSWRVFVKRWVTVPDPGLTRLMVAVGAAFAAAATVATLYVLFTVLFTTAAVLVLPLAMFGGMVGLYTAAMRGNDTEARRKLTTALMVLPAVVAAILSAAVVPSFVLSTTVLVVVVLLTVWIGGFGPRLATLGQIGFMSFYYGLMLHFRLAMLPSLALAAVLGVIWAYLFRFVFMAQESSRVLVGGLDAFYARLVMMLEPLVDAVSAARWDPDVRNRARTDLRQLNRCAAFLQGQLRAIDLDSAGPLTDDLRLLLFDTELAATHVYVTARDFAKAGAAVSVVLRGKLAGMLDRAQDQLRHHDSQDASGRPPLVQHVHHEKPEDDATPYQGWPERALRLQEAILELLRASSALRDAQNAARANPRVAGREVIAETVSRTPYTAAGSTSGQPDDGWSWSHGLRAPATRRAIQAAVATGLALLAGTAVTSAHQYWAALAAFLVLGGASTVEETVVKGFQRIAGTIMGAIIGFWVSTLTGTNPFVILPLVLVCIFAAMYLRPVSYARMVFWMTMMLALLYEFLGTLTKETLQVRVLETIIGAAIALAVSVLLLPIRTRKEVNDDGVALLKTLDDITQICLKRLTGGSDVRSLTDQALTLDQRFRQLNSRVEPLRHSSGALAVDGIERRLTAASALTYYARHLIKATETLAPGDAPLPSAVGAQLGTITRENITALIQILNEELPGPVHGSEDLPLETSGSPSAGSDGEREAVHYLVSINQTVLAVIKDMTRDTAESADDVKSPRSHRDAFALGAND